jgi:solute:Na+ symporter, SSS family
MSLSNIDLAILAAYLLGMVLLGVVMGRGTRSASHYMLGGRDVSWWLILFSIISTETSAVTFLSIPGFAFSRDMTWLQIPIGFLIGRILVARLLLPLYFRGELFTSYEVLARRFGGATEQLAAAFFILTRTLADGLRLFLTAIVVQEVTGLSLTWAVVLTGGATLVYTFFGGMQGVLWTDLVQFVIYIGGALFAFYLLLERLPGGFSELLAVGGEAGKLRFFDPSFDLAEPYTFWAGIFGGVFVALGSHGVDQLMVQRYLCARNLGDARKALVGSGFVVAAQFALFLLIGVALFAFYQRFPPEAAFDRPDRVFAFFILREMPPGVVGLLVGAVIAAAMGSSLNACATAFTRDLYRPHAGAAATPEKELRVTRIFTVVFGILQIGVGIAGQQLASSVVGAILGIAAFTTGIVLGVFFLGIFLERVGQRAALAGFALGLAAMIAIYFATPLAWPWYALAGSAFTFAAGGLASELWPRSAAEREV